MLTSQGAKRALASRPSGEWKDEDYDVLADTVVGGARRAGGCAVVWTPMFGHHDYRTPTHGYEPTREAAMTAFAKSWRGQSRQLLKASRSVGGDPLRPVPGVPPPTRAESRAVRTARSWRGIFANAPSRGRGV